MDTSQSLSPQALVDADAQLGLPEVPTTHPVLLPLSQLRIEKNLTAEFAASSLRLKTAQILALEQQDWQRLPGPAYIKGFLRSYCKFLQVDAQPYVEQYDQSTRPAQPPSQQPFAQSAVPLAPAVAPSAVSAVLGDPQLPLAHFDEANELNAQRKRTFLTAFALVGATLVFLLFWERALWLPPIQAQLKEWLPSAASVPAPAPIAPAPGPAPAPQLPEAAKGSEPAAVSAAPASESNVPTPATAASSSADAQTLNTAKTDNAKTVDVQFIEPVWLELRDKTGAAVITGMHKAGTSAKIKADAPLLLIVGASHAVKVMVEGKSLDLEPHTAGNVAKVKIP